MRLIQTHSQVPNESIMKAKFLDMTEVFKGFWKQDEFTKLLSSKVHNAQHHHSPELNIY